MVEHDVVVVGAGPTGLVLAGELALADVDVVVVERRPDQSVESSRAGGLQARTLEVLDQRGIAERFLDAGRAMQVQAFSMIPLDISDLPSRHPHGLALWQRDVEPLLAAWVDELGVPLLRDREVLAVAQDDAGVDVEVSDGTSMRCRYVVGCDGGRSTVRRDARIEATTWTPSTSWLVAEVDLDDEPALGMRWDDLGSHGGSRIAPDGPFRLVLTERELHAGDPDVDDLRTALVDVYGSDLGLRHVHWVSRFTDAARQATTYRSGRLLLAGDAAHVHSPHGGQGLNTGVQDAMNLGWKLAQVVRGTSTDALLDTYHAERHPVGARAIRTAMAQAALNRGGAHHQALRDTMAEVLAMDEPRRHLGGILSGLTIAYDLGGGHPLVGHRVPDLGLSTAEGETRIHALLHEARPVLVDLEGSAAGPAAPWADRVRLVEATCEGPWALPVLGEVPPPAAVLVRPDGHVAWAGDPDDPALPEALTTWFGSPRTAEVGRAPRA